MRFHIKSKMHLDRIAKKENTHTESVEQETTEENETEDNESNQFFNQTPRNAPTNKNEEYLHDFNNVNFQIQEEKPKEVKQNNSLILKDIKHKFRHKKDDDDYSVKSDDLFSNKYHTEILGKSRQYKLLFKEELKSFRIKKTFRRRFR